MSTTPHKFKKAGRLLAYLLLLFVFQEVVLRICFPLPEIRNFDRISYMELDQEGLRYTRNQSRAWQSVVDTQVVFSHAMNHYGFRDTEWKISRPAGKQRALFIGDSFVEGIMAPQDQTIPAGFQAAAPDFEVMNAGMVGKGLDAYLQLAADITPIFKPDVAFLCIYANDLGQEAPAVPQYYLEPEYFAWYVPRFYTVLTEGRRTGPILPRWDRSVRPYLTAVPDSSNPWTDQEVRLRPHVDARLAAKMKKGTFNPFRTNALAVEAKFLKLPPKLGETVPFFKYICEQNQVEPVIVYFPSRNQVTRHYYPYEHQLCQLVCPDSLDLTTAEYQLHQQVLARQCQTIGVQFIDLTPEVRAKEAAGAHLFWNYDEHMKGKGYLFLGNTIWKRWKKK